MSDETISAIVVSAPSGAGKSTVVERALARLDDIRFSVSHTTRPPRPGELDGREYHFVDRGTFEALIAADRFLEHAEVHGHLYGTCWSEHERAVTDRCDLLLDLDVQGAAQVRGRLPDAITVFVLPPSYADLERRLRGRGKDDEATIERRLAAAGRELRALDGYDYALINDDLDRCVEDLLAVIRAARARVSRRRTRTRGILETFGSDGGA